MKSNICKTLIGTFALSLLMTSTAGWAQDEEDEDVAKIAWVGLSAAERREVLSFAEDYKTFMTSAKTELSFVTEAIGIARAAGFRELNSSSNLRPGARFYDVNRDRTITLIVV
jgi:hypothetical protein